MGGERSRDADPRRSEKEKRNVCGDLRGAVALSLVFSFFSLASEPGPLGRVLTALALMLKASGRSTEEHTHTLAWIQTGGRYQLDCLPLLVAFYLLTLSFPKEKEGTSLLGHDSPGSKMYSLQKQARVCVCAPQAIAADVCSLSSYCYIEQTF